MERHAKTLGILAIILIGLGILNGCKSDSSSPSPSPVAASIPVEPVRALQWSNPNTWAGKIPAAGDDVTIPAGQTVILNTSPPALSSLNIMGTLIFSDDQDINLTAKAIMVHGKLQIGTETAPYMRRAVITLTGNDTSQDVMGMGTKVLGAMMGGTIDIHGKPVNNSWTRLAQTAIVGATTLVLQDAPTWQQGDQLVVASTDYDPTQAEVVTIASVSGTIVTLTRPLKHMHYGEVQMFGDTPLREQAEVGLLNHNILIQGDIESDTNGFGGHVMIMGNGITRIENVEFYRMGQKSRTGRYPVHFHRAGDASGSYVKSSSIHNTYNRCLTIHDTNNVLVEGNVAYNAIGHCYFLEDGAETGNVFERNLGLLTKRPKKGEELLASDIESQGPATFWITNPDNTLRNNAAAGSEGSGYWYALPEQPTGQTDNVADKNIWPRRTPLKEFTGNVAHSNGNTGLFVDRGPSANLVSETTVYKPIANPADLKSASVPANFELLAYKNREMATWLRGSGLRLTNTIVADNARGVIFANDNNTFSNSIVIGESQNIGTPKANEKTGLDGRTLPRPWQPASPIFGTEYYDGPTLVENVMFYNFVANLQRPASAVTVLNYTDFAMSPQNTSAQLRFVNSRPLFLETRMSPTTIADTDIGEDGYRSAVILDKDGTLSGTAGSYVTVNNSFLTTPACRFQSVSNTYTCPESYGRLVLQNHEPNPSIMAPVVITRSDNRTRHTLLGTPASGNNTQFVTQVLANRTYRITTANKVPTRLKLLYTQSSRPEQGDNITVAIDFPYASATVTRDYSSAKALPPATDLAMLTANNYYLDTLNRTLYIKPTLAATRGSDIYTIIANP